MEVVDAVTPPSATLEYASPRAKIPWGPVVFRPSRAALLFLMLTAIAAAWLGLRHHPWREVARLPSSYYQGSPFTADGRLLTLDPDHGANLWTPDGSLVRNVLPKLDLADSHYYIVRGGERILELPRSAPEAVFWDVGSGKIVDSAFNPLSLGVRVWEVYPNGSRLITVGIPRSHLTSATVPATTQAARSQMLGQRWGPAMVWELSKPRVRLKAPRPLKEVSLSPWTLSFSPDGSRLLFPGGRNAFVLWDAATLETVGHAQGGGGPGWCDFINDQLFYVDAPFPTTQPTAGLWEVIELRSTRDGQPVRTIPLISPAPLGAGYDRLMISPDARHALRLRVITGVAARPGGLLFSVMQIWDLYTGKLIQTRDALNGRTAFFPGSSRYVTAEPMTERVAVYSPRHRRPLAILPGRPAWAAGSQIGPFVAPDGQTIAIPGDDMTGPLALFRPAGRDCPESHLGALAFPHLWLMTASLVAAALLLRQGAARHNTSGARAPAFVAAILFAVTLPLTAYGLASLCVEQDREALALAPAALLLITAIGLATGSRFWRLAALCALAAALPYELWQAHRIWKAGIPGQTLYPVLDRHFEIPHLPALVGHAAAVTLLALGLVLLPRSTRVAR